MDRDKINSAVQRCLTIGPTDNWKYEDKIDRIYGQKVLKEISEILAFLNTVQPNWSKESYEEFLVRVSGEIKSNYPILQEESVKVLKNRVAYYWK